MTDGIYDKYQLIDSLIVQVDALTDLRGVEKCKTILDIIGKLSALRNGLKNDDDENKKKIEQYRLEIAELSSDHEETVAVLPVSDKILPEG